MLGLCHRGAEELRVKVLSCLNLTTWELLPLAVEEARPCDGPSYWVCSTLIILDCELFKGGQRDASIKPKLGLCPPRPSPCQRQER